MDDLSPYIGVCFNDEHVSLLHKMLIEHVLTNLGDEQSKHYQAAFKAGLNKNPKTDKVDKTEAKPQTTMETKGQKRATTVSEDNDAGASPKTVVTKRQRNDNQSRSPSPESGAESG